MGKKQERISIIFLDDHMKMAAEALSPRDCGRLFEMIRAYSMEGKETDVSGESRLFRSLYVMMRRAQDKDIERYQETCERNRRAALVRTQQTQRMQRAQQTQHMHANAANTIQSNTIQSNMTHSGDDPLDREGTGVPGIGWLE